MVGVISARAVVVDFFVVEDDKVGVDMVGVVVVGVGLNRMVDDDID